MKTRGQSSVLAQGDWYKFAVEKRGVYKLDKSLLQNAGVAVDNIDPKKIRIFSSAGGMVPQAITAGSTADLSELSIEVVGEADGVFNTDDYILVYMHDADKATYDSKRDIMQYEHNLYADKNFLFLTVDGSILGKRIQESPDIAGAYPVINTFNDFIFHELDEHNELQSGREWFGELFDVTTAYTFTFDVSGMVAETPMKFVSDVMAQSSTGSSFTVSVNGVSAVDQYVLPISSYEYGEKGSHRRDTSLLSAPSTSALEIKYVYTKANTGSVGYLNFFLTSYVRTLALYGDQTIFRSQKSLNNAVSQFAIAANSDVRVWNITDVTNVTKQKFAKANNTLTFAAETASILREFIVFNNTLPTPVFIEQVPNQDLHGLTTPSLVIIAHPSFLSEAQRLSDHRTQHNGISVQVVSIDEVYNEFGSGRQDVSAIRNFVKSLYDKNQSALKNLLLIGRGSYDYKDRISPNTNFVATYESRNSLHPLNTYSSDDFYGLLEDGKGVWAEGGNPDYTTLDIGVGRIPAKSIEELTDVVDKLIDYDVNAQSFGKWRQSIAFVADDGDNNLHQSQANALADFIETSYPLYTANKIFIDAWPQVVKPNGESVPEANKKIIEAIDRGSFIVNYTGHGGELLWAQERIFDDNAIYKLTNKQYPLFVTATCAFGRQDNPTQISGAELLLLKRKGGAIGMVSTTRPVEANTNFQLNKAFYNAVFEKDDGQSLSLGEIFKQTKNNSISGVSNRNFSLLGDPSMHLAYPSLHIQINKISSPSTTDTLSAMAHVTVQGELVNDDAVRVTSFDGVLNAVLYDKEAPFKTLGNQNPPFIYTQWYNALFRGKTEVKAGEFQFDFIVSKNIAYQLGKGKLSLYAADFEHFIDAAGTDVDFVVGKTAVEGNADTTPPSVALYLNDASFVNGGLTNPNPILIAHMTDASGINISGYGVGNNCLAVIDDRETIILNDYYESDLNTFTAGSLKYPLHDLAPGPHTITLKVWDNFNNGSQTNLSFFVTDGEALQIDTFGNYPNPFRDQTTFSFTHNRTGDDLEVALVIYDLAGKIISNTLYSVKESPYRVDLIEIERDSLLGKKMNGGLYLARIVVRSLTNGSKNEQVTKLIMLN